MSKDHKPGGFNRTCDYKSDLEMAEERGTRINTSFSSGNANVYVHNAEHTHEHFWYDPVNNSCGYHGENVPTHNNHPVVNVNAEPTEVTESVKGPETEKTEIVSTEEIADTNMEHTDVEVESECNLEDDIEADIEVECDDGVDL